MGNIGAATGDANAPLPTLKSEERSHFQPSTNPDPTSTLNPNSNPLAYNINNIYSSSGNTSNDSHSHSNFNSSSLSSSSSLFAMGSISLDSLVVPSFSSSSSSEVNYNNLFQDINLSDLQSQSLDSLEEIAKKGQVEDSSSNNDKNNSAINITDAFMSIENNDNKSANRKESSSKPDKKPVVARKSKRQTDSVLSPNPSMQDEGTQRRKK